MLHPSASLLDDEETNLPLASGQSVGYQYTQEHQGPEAEPNSDVDKPHQLRGGAEGGGFPHLQNAPQRTCIAVEQKLLKGGQDGEDEGSAESKKGSREEEEESVAFGASDVTKENTDVIHVMSRQWWHTSRPSKLSSRATPRGRWLTPEFLFYYVYAAHFYYLFFSQSVALSNQFASVPALRPWLRGLRPGWLWGRQLDLTDHQWRAFRESLPLLAPAMFLFAAVGRWALPWCAASLARVLRLKPVPLAHLTLAYWLLVSGALVLYLHGLATVFPVALAGLNYLLVQRLKGHRRFLGILWAYHCASFLAIRTCDGFPFAMLERPLTLLLSSSGTAVSLMSPQRVAGGGVQPLVHQWLAWADSHRGALRWHICYNLLLLRMISYGCDQHWEYLGRTSSTPAGAAGPHGQGASATPLSGSACSAPAGEGLVHRSTAGGEAPPAGSSPQQGEERGRLLPRVSTGAPPARPLSSADATPGLLYTVHLFFAPLYVAGPIIPYHAFAAQVRGLDGVPLPAKDASRRGGSSSSSGKESHMTTNSNSSNNDNAAAKDASTLPSSSSSSSSSRSHGGHSEAAPPSSPQGLPPHCRPAAVQPRALAVYLLRAALALGCLEALLHWCYFPALAGSRLWRHMTPAQLCLLSYGTLNFVWLKFLTIWRLSRLWALIAGFDPPENILRCLSNNYSVQGFWRGWHASYNRWIVRYLYVPLGGARYKALNAWVVFTFVALWHDLEWKLLAWAWLMCLLLLPELLLSWAAARPPLKEWQGTALFREGTAVLGAVNILGLMLANLVGFVVGPSGASEFAARLLAPNARPLLLYLVVSMYVGVKLMLEVRELEARNKGRQGGVLGEDSAHGARQHMEKREHQS